MKLSWSDSTTGPSEREPVRLAWSDDSSARNGLGAAWPSTWPTVGASSSSEADGPLSKAEVSELGLPIRVRQANLAPQLRKSAPRAAADAGAGIGFYSGAAPAAGNGRLRPGDSAIDPFAPRRSGGPAGGDSGAPLASPEAARNTMSALQRGWELGRSEAGQAADQPSGSGYSPSGYAPGPSAPPQMPTPLTDSADQRDDE